MEILSIFFEINTRDVRRPCYANYFPASAKTVIELSGRRFFKETKVLIVHQNGVPNHTFFLN